MGIRLGPVLGYALLCYNVVAYGLYMIRALDLRGHVPVVFGQCALIVATLLASGVMIWRYQAGSGVRQTWLAVYATLSLTLVYSALTGTGSQGLNLLAICALVQIAGLWFART